MDEKAVGGIILVVIALFGLALFFPIYSPAAYGGWGCPMLGRGGYGGMMNRGGGPYSGAPFGPLGSMFLFDGIFLAVLLGGIYLIWKSTRTA